jgi:hypothetical protein
METSNGNGSPGAFLLSTDRSGWRIHDGEDHNSRRLLSATLQVLRRAQYTCAHCGFRSTPDEESVPDLGAAETNARCHGYLQVHPRHGDHVNWKLADLDAVCPFCHETLHSGAGLVQDSGSIVACPWIGQADLCLLCNAMAAASAESSATAAIVERLWIQLERGRIPVQAGFGLQRLPCGLFASGLLTLRDKAPDLYARRAEGIGDLRYLPDRVLFAQAIAYWRTAAWLPVSKWQEVYGRWLRRLHA